MTCVDPSPRVSPGPGEEWVLDLDDDGSAGRAAQAELHALLLRAARHQVHRLRHLLPGAGAADLDDLAHQAADDAMVDVLRRLGTFEGRSRFSTWAWKFALLHAGVGVRRQAWRHREVPLPDSLTVVDRGASPADVTEGAQLGQALEVAITEALTPHQRRVVLALLVEQVPIDVLADRVGSTRNALYKTLHDARRRLRAELVAAGYLDPARDGRTR